MRFMASGKNRNIGLGVLYSLLLLAGLLLFYMGSNNYTQAQKMRQPTEAAAMLMGLGAASMLITASLWPIAMALAGGGAAAGGGDKSAEADRERSIQLLRSINERLLLSDHARRYNARKHDRDLLKRAIQEDLNANDLDSAMRLAKELSEIYGYAQESEEVRDQIQHTRAAQYQQRVDQAINNLEVMLAEQRWEEASAEAAKIQRLYPDSHRVVDLPRRVQQSWEQHKQDLERQFLEAAKRDDIEQAMALLKELDKFLSEQEAAPFMEVARGVIGKKKENLGVQFKLAVHDRDWIGATQVGDQIIREFPNTRMSDEVRSMIDLLRERAASQRAAIAQGA